ncbi:hypothetical protein FM076_31105 [Streptomyces albus subsp. chlorinus]|uniref:hypothetical protein n=1 Tax=Streptomyces albus TaxID=1888 RepID=UPI00156E7306|nr:hypothetical protein [Streptomyces albus]NSC25361.1 hypothetical protein [Streptomyces albus subsp. chlorinus]
MGDHPLDGRLVLDTGEGTHRQAAPEVLGAPVVQEPQQRLRAPRLRPSVERTDRGEADLFAEGAAGQPAEGGGQLPLSRGRPPGSVPDRYGEHRDGGSADPAQ